MAKRSGKRPLRRWARTLPRRSARRRRRSYWARRSPIKRPPEPSTTGLGTRSRRGTFAGTSSPTGGAPSRQGAPTRAPVLLNGTPDWSVQLQILRRGGLKGTPALSEPQVTSQNSSIRQAQEAKTQQHVEEGKKMKRPSKAGGEKGSEANARVGHDPPVEFTDFHPTDQESALQALVAGPDFGFYDDAHAGRAVKKAPSLEGLEKQGLLPRQQAMDQVDASGLASEFEGLLQTFLKNRLLQLKEADPSLGLTQEHVGDLLEQARAQGGPELSAAADEALQRGGARRAGSLQHSGVLSTFTWKDGVGSGVLQWPGGAWDVLDYGDQLHPSGERLSEVEGRAAEGPEARQCLLLHSCAGLLLVRSGRAPSLTEVQKLANEVRADLVCQASRARLCLGDPPRLPPS